VKHAFRITWRSLRDTYEELFVLVGANLLALLLFLPLVTGPPALAGLHYLGFHIATEKRIEFGFFWQGFKDYFLDSWKLAALNVVVLGVLGGDVWFYLTQVQGAWRVLGFVGAWMLLIWAVAQLYTFPLLVRQEERKFFLLIKNSVLLTLAYPVFSLTAAVLLALVLALSIVVPVAFVLVGLSFAAVMSAHALNHSIEMVEAYRAQQSQEQDDDRTS
jgi:uncharacterized membrane protein YesL